MSPKFLAHIVILCFDRRYPKQNSVIRVKSNILVLPNFLTPPKFWTGYAIADILGSCRGIQGEVRRLGDRSSKTYESNIIHHDFLQFGKHHSRYKVIFRPLFCHSSVVK